ncbi:MAG TPA: PIN domain-containing protein [Thermoanaerobaculia bacterium]
MFFDTNVVLDVMLDREPYAAASAEVLSRVEAGDLTGCICATTVTTTHYLATRAIGAERALAEVKKLLSLFEIAPVGRTVLETALDLGFADYEDAVLHETARQVSAQGIVTRNGLHFRKAALPLYTPEELSRALELRDQEQESGNSD